MNLTSMSTESLYLLEAKLREEIRSRSNAPNEVTLEGVDRIILKHVPSLIYRTKYLVDKYHLHVRDAKALVEAWDVTNQET